MGGWVGGLGVRDGERVALKEWCYLELKRGGRKKRKND